MFRLLARLLRHDEKPRTRKTAEVSGTVEFLETSRAITLLIFLATTTAIVLISSVGISTINLPVLPNQLSSVGITASVPFSYESQEKTRDAIEQVRDRTPPVYRLDFSGLRQFQTHLQELLTGLDALQEANPGSPPFIGKASTSLNALVDAFNAKGSYHVTPQDVTSLLRMGDAATRDNWVAIGLRILQEIYAQGVREEHGLDRADDPGEVTVFQITRNDGVTSLQSSQSLEQALTYLRMNLTAETGSRELSEPLYHIFRDGVAPDLVYDRDATIRLQNEAIAKIKPVRVNVERGQVIVAPGTRVTPAQYEMLGAEREFLLKNGDTVFDDNLQLFGRVLLVLAMVLASFLYVRLEDPETLLNNGRLGLLALVVIANLALVRATCSLGGLPYFIHDSQDASVLPFLAPTALAPLIVAILIDAGSSIFMALFISIFTAVIYGNRLDLLVLTFVSSLVAIHCARRVRRRGNIVRAGLFGGLTVVVFSLLVGIVNRVDFLTILKHMGAGLLTGLLTGVIVAGLLPILESLFKRTTDITLLELTDYNHPLLHLMQMEAPGTYHHSLMVAQLAENAASAIGANPLLARVCALFHDIGKTGKPEYFVENQRDGVNPHDDSNPSLSALIIKSHVKDGIDLAVKHNLPRAVIDVIRQHHGTGLIRYFYHRAVTGIRPAAKLDASPNSMPSAPGLEPAPVSESTYRYDGPKPRFKESAIIHLADGVEAAARSLRKVTPQHLSELIDQIFKERMNDGQLDEAPLTFEELAKIKTSFTFTLLNMLHGRVAYPPPEPDAKHDAPPRA